MPWLSNSNIWILIFSIDKKTHTRLLILRSIQNTTHVLPHTVSVADPEGVQGILSNPPPRF